MINKIKKTILYLGIAIIIEIVILNLIFQVSITDNLSEFVEIKVQNPIFITLAVILGAIIFALCYFINQTKINSKKIKIGIVIGLLLIYLITQIVFINYRNAYPNFDQLNVYEAAVDMYNGNEIKMTNHEYMEKHPHQVVLAFLESVIFRICNSTNIKIIQYLNAIGNCFTVLAIILITKLITNKKNRNLVLPLFTALTFIPILLLSTFVYGDEISLAFSLFSVFFIMKYGKEKRAKYLIISAICMSLGYAFRKNSLIFIIALTIYLISKLLESIVKKKDLSLLKRIKNKNTIISIGMIVLFLIITTLPVTTTLRVLQKKYSLDRNDAIPAIYYLFMGMSESPRANGWYSIIKGYDFSMNLEETNKLYKPAIQNRAKHLISNPLYTISFYTLKTASMWAEDTNASIYYNQSFNFKQNKDEDKDNEILDKKPIIAFYMKTLYLLIFITILIALLKNNKNISNEILLLIIVFIGGFIFHTMWEGKSRYILPYVITIIPIMALPIKLKIEKNVSKK